MNSRAAPDARPPAESRSTLLNEILCADDRDHCPGARPVVSLSDQDASEYLNEVRLLTRRSVVLSRRGCFHGEWAELDERASRTMSRGGELDHVATRWHA